MNYYLAKSIVQTIVITLVFLLLLIVAFIAFYNPLLERGYGSNIPEGSLETNTLFTRRVYGSSPVDTAVAISQTVYPATFANNRPNAVILVREDKWQDAVVAANLIHHPIDAPILYVQQDRLPAATKNELKRLKPEGLWLDGNVQVYIVGSVANTVVNEVRQLGYKVKQFSAADYYQLQEQIDEYLAVLHTDHCDSVIVVSDEKVEYALAAAAWAAHERAALFFVKKDGVPAATKRALSERFNGACIYVMGPAGIIGKNAVAELAGYGLVQRIPGTTAAEVAVAFARFRDVGGNYGLWVVKGTREFGWGLSEPGHNYTIVNPARWQVALPAVLFSHRGKHGVMLYSHADALDEATLTFLTELRPPYIDRRQQIYSFAWVIGDFSTISVSAQHQLEGLLRPQRKGGTKWLK